MSLFGPTLAGSAGQGPSADLGETIEQSLRFRGGISGTGNGGMLSKTITTSSTTAALTISFWVKLGNIPSGYNRFIFSSGTAGSASGNISYDNASNQSYIRFQDTSSYTAFTTQKLRDFSAWYHIVYRFDAANQYVKVYVNGSEHSSTSIATSARTSFGATSPMQIGRYADSSYANNYWDGYLAEWNMLFGTSLGPDSFGRTNDDGVWVPKDLSDLTSNQYGALGNRLVFDSSAGLGDDTAPTGGTHASANNFTATGFDEGDVALWSSQVFTTGWSTQDFTSTRQNFNSTQPPTGSFDGSGSTAGQSAGGNDDSTYFVRFTTPIQNVTSIEMKPTNGSGYQYHYINGVQGTFSSGGVKQTIYSGTAITLETVGVNWISSNAGSGFYQLWVNGTELIDNFDNDVDYNDTPTSNYATFNPIVNPGFGTNHDSGVTPPTFSEANLRATGAQNNYPGVAMSTVTGDKVYFEFTSSGNDSHRPSLTLCNINYTTNSRSSSSLLEVYRTGGATANGSTSLSNGTFPTWGADDVVRVTYDNTTHELSVAVNGGSFTTYDLDNFSGYVVPDDYSFGLGLNDVGHYGYINYGQRPFVYSVPNGFSTLQTNILPEPTIKNGKKHFEAIIWDGNGVDDRNITTTEGFAPDFVWIKRRTTSDGTGNHVLFDTVRGATKRLMSNFTNAEDTQANDLQAFNSDGFQIGTQTRVNATGQTYVAWCWKAGGTAVSNTDGTITSSVSANTDAGFSIVSYTGTGSNATVGHGLTEAPEWVVTTNRTDGGGWSVWHTGIAATQVVNLNNTSAAFTATHFNSTAPSSSIVNLGSHNNTNESGKNHIMYCWHSVEGFSKFGSYEGNSSSDGPFVYTGHKTAFLMIRNVDGTGNWMMLDTSRQSFNPNSAVIYANQNTAEYTSTGFPVDFLSNGFKVRVNDGNLNTSGQTYVYMSFAENPFGGENQPPATAR